MRRNYIIILLTLMIILSGCASETTNDIGSANNDSKGNGISKKDSVVNKEENRQEESNDGGYERYKVEDIRLGETFEVKEKFEFTLQNVELTTLIEPTHKNDFYSYYEVKEDDVIYLDVIVDVKNIGKRSRSADDFLDVRVMYEKIYEYYGFSVIEEKGGSDFTYTNITSVDPLKTGTIHYVIELPDVVEDNPEEIKVIIDTENNEHYHYEY